jgi:Transposase IS116/IS110/IS902 family
LRRQLRFRRLVVEETVRFKNKTAGLWMEAGVEYAGPRLHGKRYFADLMKTELDQELRPLLEFSRSQTEELKRMDHRLMRWLEQHPRLEARVEALRQIDGVGPVTALSWCLEVGDPARFGSIQQAVSYCGLASALRESAGQQKRGPLSKQRNRHLQTVLIEAAKIGVLYHPKVRELYDRARQKGLAKRGTPKGARQSSHASGGAQAGGLSAGGRSRLSRSRGGASGGRLRGAFLEASQIYPSEISRFSAGEAEAGSAGEQPAKEYPARLIRVKSVVTGSRRTPQSRDSASGRLRYAATFCFGAGG